MLKAALGTIIDYLKRSDKVFWLLTAVVSVYGCLLIASLQRDGGTDFLLTQIIAVLLGYVAAVAVSLVDYHQWGRHWWVVGGLALLLTMAVFVIGIQIEGTDDVGWIRLPGGLTFQPSELTKIGFIVTFSQHIAFLSEKQRLTRPLGVLTLLLHAMVPIGLIHFQGDDGAALVFALLMAVMTFAAGVPLRYFLVLPCVLLPAVPLVWLKFLNDDQKNRLLVLFSADDSMLKTYGWQQYQGKLSIASGGLFGQGYGSGTRVAENVVPYQENDFIFTVAGEELGLTEFNPIYLGAYPFFTGRDSELVVMFAAVGHPTLHPDQAEVSEGKWWSYEELDAAMGKDILTPNFEQEFSRIREQLKALL